VRQPPATTVVAFGACGTSFKNVVNLGGGNIEYQLLGTGEPHGTIRFTGAFDTLTWRSLSSEFWMVSPWACRARRLRFSHRAGHPVSPNPRPCSSSPPAAWVFSPWAGDAGSAQRNHTDRPLTINSCVDRSFVDRENTVDVLPVRGQRGAQDGQAGRGAARDQGRWW
jgi:hypothetical protein